MGLCDEFFADALALECLIDGKVGEVGAVVEVRDCARDTDEKAAIGTCGDEDIGIFEHSGDGLRFIDGPPMAECGSS